MNRSMFLIFALILTSFSARAQNAAAVLEKLNTYLPAAPRDGNLYSGVTPKNQPCQVTAAFDANTYFVSITLDPKTPSTNYHLMIQPTRYEATPLVGQREVPGRAIQYASRYLVTPYSVTGHATAQATDESIMVLKENELIRTVTINQDSCMNLRLVRGPSPMQGHIPLQRWEDYNRHHVPAPPPQSLR